jgi:hypothetical protein
MKINIKKIYVKLNKMFNLKSDNRISREERCLMIIVKKLLSIPETDLLMMPNMNKAYIRSDDRQIFVVIDMNNRSASVVNHHFGYDLRLSQRVLNYVSDNFTVEVEKRRTNMENEYMTNIQYSLSNVIQNLEKRTNEKN